MRVLRCLALLALLALTGCGRPVGQPTGKVTFSGQPAGGADLKFVGSQDATLEFFGLSRDDGSYLVSFREHRGLPVGKYQVTVTQYVLRNNQPLPPGEAGASLKASGKAFKRAFTFEKDITSGTNAIDFDLSQGQPAKAD